jgi:TolA-binding protein
MDCHEREQNELVEQYLTGQLDPARQDEFETHILECPRCLQALEVLQNVRDDLADRAHEIRSQSSVQRVRFRWHWVTVVPVLAIVVVVFFRVWHVSPSAPLRSEVALKSPPVSGGAKDASIASGTVAEGPAPSAERKSSKPPTSTISTPPTLASGPDSSEGKPLASHESGTPATGGQPNTTEIVSAPPVSHDQAPPIPGNNDKTATSATATKKPALENDEAAKERFRLGIVQPPPYTFSGFASAKLTGGKGPKSDLGKALGAPGGKPGQQNSTEIARGLFQKAMDAYLEQRYSAAASLLEDAAQVEPKAPDVNFFLGICRIMLAKPEDAVAPLKNVLADEKSPYALSAHYYLAKAYVQTDQLSEAEAQLQAAAAIPGRLRSEASSMLSRVQALRAMQGPSEQNPKHN